MEFQVIEGIQSAGFSQSKADYSMVVVPILLLYFFIDDIILAGPNQSVINDVKLF